MEETDKIVKRVVNPNQAFMNISRIPKDTKEKIIKLAEEEFCNDYGMTLKFLYDFYETRGMFEYLLKEIENLKQQRQPEEKKITLLDGRVLGEKDE
jgi:hypothetical protein